jgi:glycosyltransferase involved in cell wall biosynthesis
MKVLVVYHSGAMGSVRSIFRELAGRPGVQLTVAVAEQMARHQVFAVDNEPVDGKAERDGYHLLPIPLKDPARQYLGYSKEALGNVMRRLQPDVIHVWEEPLSVPLEQVAALRPWKCRNAKVLFYGFENLPHRLGLRQRAVWSVLWRQIAGGAAANHAALANARAAGLPADRPTARIFWGIPTDTYQPMDRERSRADLKFGGEFVVGMIGRLTPEKGATWLLAALARLPAQVHCVFIGAGPQRADLELLAQLPALAGRIRFVDAVPPKELARYMNAMDVLAVPSLTTPHWKEQYGRVIPEAMACGLPVIGSDSGAIPEVIESAGIIVAENDIAGLASAIDGLRVDETRRQDLRARGLQRVASAMSASAMARDLHQLYRVVTGAD